MIENRPSPWENQVILLSEKDVPDIMILQDVMQRHLPCPRWYYTSEAESFAAHARAQRVWGIRDRGQLIALNIIVPGADLSPHSYGDQVGDGHEGTLDFQDIMVHPDYRRQGIHTLMMRRAEAFCAQKNLHTLYATVDPDNLPSLTAFGRFGYERVMEKEIYDGRPRVFLRKKLREP